MDDMVVKTKRGQFHLDDLKEIFTTLTEYNLKLNHIKCTFGVKFEKFMGFMTSELVIEENPHKI